MSNLMTAYHHCYLVLRASVKCYLSSSVCAVEFTINKLVQKLITYQNIF